MIKQYLQVTKPGIIFGNLISVIGGFLLASKGSIDYPLFLVALVGVSLVVASGCVFNNVIDRDIDIKMERAAEPCSGQRPDLGESKPGLCNRIGYCWLCVAVFWR